MSFDETTQRALPSARVTHLHLLRHGRVDTGGQRLAYGQLDLPLSEEGRRDHDALLGFAATQLPRPDGIISSDLGRCRSLAERLAERLGVPLRLETALREQHMGAWEGRAWAELTAEDNDGVQAYWDDYLRATPPGGESYGDTCDRAVRWLDEATWLDGGRWVVVTHIGIIRAWLCQSLGVPFGEALRFTPPRGSHTHLLLADAGACVQAMGERPLTEVVGGARVIPTDRPPRIALSGSAGTGKTTFGTALAEQLGVPFIPEGMRERIEGGLDLHSFDLEGYRSLLLELRAEQHDREDRAITTHGGFVSDRSPWDFVAFWFRYNLVDDEEETARVVAQARERAEALDHILVFPWGVLPLHNDGVRATNPWVQRTYQALLEGLLNREVAAPRLVLLPPLEDLQERLRWVRMRMGL